MTTTLTETEINRIKTDKVVRKRIARQSHLLFFSIYLSHYITYPFALFHYEMFSVTENTDLKLAVFLAFRGSSKSTLMTLSYPIWAITGCQQKKFVLIVSQTQNQARLHLSNIRKELESNELLKKDIGPFQETNDEWGATSIVLSNFNARITIASTEQSIRGLRHGQYRPDLVICDDVDDLNSVKNRESRDKTFNWFTGEILPIGDNSTKFIVIGNLLHEDCLLMRLKSMIENKTLDGKYYSYPLIDDNQKIYWLGKFADPEAIDKLKKSVGSEISWYREYLLKIISPDDQIIKKEWIKIYDSLPLNIAANCIGHVISVDPAISQKQTADKTAIIVGAIYKSSDFHYLYITQIYNIQIGFPETKDLIKELSNTVDPKHKTPILVEQIAYQEALIQALQKEGYPAKGINPHGNDKRARLNLASSYVRNGNVLFPKNSSSELVDQLLNFGVERYDDLADAFTMMVSQVFASPNGLPSKGPMLVKCNLYNSINISNSSNDWADTDDQRMLSRVNPRAKWKRILN